MVLSCYGYALRCWGAGLACRESIFQASGILGNWRYLLLERSRSEVAETGEFGLRKSNAVFFESLNRRAETCQRDLLAFDATACLNVQRACLTFKLFCRIRLANAQVTRLRPFPLPHAHCLALLTMHAMDVPTTHRPDSRSPEQPVTRAYFSFMGDFS